MNLTLDLLIAGTHNRQPLCCSSTEEQPGLLILPLCPTDCCAATRQRLTLTLFAHRRRRTLSLLTGCFPRILALKSQLRCGVYFAVALWVLPATDLHGSC